jgi:chitinase
LKITVRQSGKFKSYMITRQASHLWNAEDRVFISYETPKEIKLKAEFHYRKGTGWRYVLGI